MLETYALTLGSVGVVSIISLSGIVLLAIKDELLQKIMFALVGFAAGSMLGDAFLHLIPETFSSFDPNVASLYVLAGIIGFFSLEHFLHWKHRCHEHAVEPHNHIHPVAHMNLIADGVHNFFDGIIIGSSYLISLPVGIATTLAIMFHEIPQELGDFAILLNAGMKKARAILLNLASALLAVFGGVCALIFGTRVEGSTQVMSAITIGGFLYIAGSDLIPELHKNPSTRRSLIQFTALLLGIFIMYLLTFLE